MKVLSSLALASAVSASAAFTAIPTGTTSSISSPTTRLFGEKAVEVATGAKDISALTKGVTTVFTTEEIDATLPHRYPFALVDKVVEFEVGKRAVGIKCVTKNEEFFQGHFPTQPVMPGVLQVEALAQLAGVICLKSEGTKPGSIFFFAGVDGVKWKKPVVPGDTLVMEVEIKKFNAKFGLAKATGRAYVDGTLAVEVDEMTFAIAKS